MFTRLENKMQTNNTVSFTTTIKICFITKLFKTELPASFAGPLPVTSALKISVHKEFHMSKKTKSFFLFFIHMKLLMRKVKHIHKKR